MNFKGQRSISKTKDWRPIEINTLAKYRNLTKYRNQLNRRRKFHSGIIAFIFIFSFVLI